MRLFKYLFLTTLVFFFCAVSAQKAGLGDSSPYDYSGLSWTAGFDSLHENLSYRYAFTDWKAIDWNEKKSITRPLIASAQQDSNYIAYTQALFEYLNSIPDGHINLFGGTDYFKYEKLGGTYGFNMIPLEDGSVLVSHLLDEKAAYLSGLRCGDQVLQWNGVAIDSIGERELWNYFRNYSTLEGRRYSRYYMLPRDPIGTVANITYKSQLSGQINTIEVEAFEDGGYMFAEGLFNTTVMPDMDSLIKYEILESGVGYLYIGAEDSDGMTPDEIKQDPLYLEVVDAISFFQQNNIQRLIVDLRFNLGGNDLFAAVLMGMFYQEASFYEHITTTVDQGFDILHSLWTYTDEPNFTGEIAVIVDPNTISTGEGLAMMFQRLPNANIVSHWGTNGAFGIVDYEPIILPLDLMVSFPQGRSLDEHYHIQLDSDSTLAGGIQPDIRVPIDLQSVIMQYQEGVDVQLKFAESFLLEIQEQKLRGQCLLYPNPGKGIVNLSFSDAEPGAYTLRLYNQLGQCCYLELVNLTSDEQRFQLDCSNLVSGVYSYQCVGSDRSFIGKLIIQ